MFKFTEWEMDFVGQKNAERLSQVIIVIFAAVGWIYGYIMQQYSMTIYISGAGFILALLACAIPWPIYQRNPVKWRKAVKSTVAEGFGVDTVDNKDSSKGKKKKAGKA